VTEPRDAVDPLLEILGGKARAQAVACAAQLGLADALSAGPLSIEALARAARCDAGRLARLVRVLCGVGVMRRDELSRVALTELGRRLGSDDLGPLAALIGAPDQWDPWSRLAERVRGAASAFELVHGQTLFAYMGAHADAARRYDAAIDAFTAHEVQALCAHYDFAHARHVVDAGGGRGALLCGLLERWPHLRGTLMDLPHVADAARDRLQTRFGDRARVESGDFLSHVTQGADHYLLKYVLHNWCDDDCVRILQNCARAAAAGGRVLVIEALLTPEGGADQAALLDLEMMVLTDGRERRKPELRRLFQRTGLRTERLVQLTRAAWLAVLRLP
jgi:hypothetical protein